MKKLILILTLTSLLISCSNSGNSSSSNNSSSGNVDYYFKIKINGVEHKVQGNTSGFAVGNNNAYDQNPNDCRAQIGTITQLIFRISDITKPNYVSGQNLQVVIRIPNCHVGLNQATVNISSSPVFDAFKSSISPPTSGIFVENNGLYSLNSNQSNSYTLYSNKITLNVTEMGTPSQYNPSTNPNSNIYAYGNTFKGSYNGTVYFTNDSVDIITQSISFDIPMQFSMEFEAYRIN